MCVQHQLDSIEFQKAVLSAGQPTLLSEDFSVLAAHTVLANSCLVLSVHMRAFDVQQTRMCPPHLSIAFCQSLGE